MGISYFLVIGRTVLSCPKVDRRVLGEADPVNSEVVDDLAFGTAMKVVDDIERKGKFAIDEWRGVGQDAWRDDPSPRPKERSAGSHICPCGPWRRRSRSERDR